MEDLVPRHFAVGAETLVLLLLLQQCDQSCLLQEMKRLEGKC